MNTTVFTAPGSLLLCGEYWITIQGGIGLAVDVPEVCAKAHVSPADRWALESRYPGSRKVFYPDSASLDDPSMAALAWLKGLGKKTPRSIVVDTTEFFSTDGRKLGFGSSAAAASLYCRSLRSDSQEELFHAAVSLHREFQGGRGSGYDVAVSLFESSGLFIGGDKPTWTALSYPKNLDAWIFWGRNAVSSKNAIGNFHRYLIDHAKDAERYSHENTAILRSLEHHIRTLGSPSDIIDDLRKAASLGIALGHAIGVSANPEIPEELSFFVNSNRPVVAKSLGAGNETVLLMAESESLASHEQDALKAFIAQGRVRKLRRRVPGDSP